MKTVALIFTGSKKETSFLIIFKNYILSGYLLHIITIVSLFFALYFYSTVFVTMETTDFQKLTFNSVFLIWLGSIPVFAQLDARSRYQNFKLLCDLLYRHGFRFRFARALRHSRCQRDAAIIAARTLGYSNILGKYYYRCGYRWYHMLPHFVFNNPLYLMSGHFWATTFFARTYNSKYFKF